MAGTASSQRFSATDALTKGWDVVTVKKTDPYDLNLDAGPPVKLAAAKWLAPPLGWATMDDVVASAYVVRRQEDLPSHAMNVAARGNSSDDIVTPSEISGWKVATEYSEWDECGYGTFYWTNTAASSILDFSFREHSIMPRGAKIRRGERVLQAFITGNKTSGSLTHKDETSSLLYVVNGSKTVFIAPPGANQHLGLKWLKDHAHTLDYNPDVDEDRDEVVWKKVQLDVCDALFIPKGWFHYVRSTPETVALSIALSPSSGTSSEASEAAPGMVATGKRKQRSAPALSQGLSGREKTARIKAARNTAANEETHMETSALPEVSRANSSHISADGHSDSALSENEDEVVIEDGEDEEKADEDDELVLEYEVGDDDDDKEDNEEAEAEAVVEDVVDDTSGDNWSGVKWVQFIVSEKCQRWPAAVLSKGQMIYIGQEPAVEVCDFTIWPEDFLGTPEDIKRATGGENLGHYMNLKHAIDEASAWVRKNPTK
jgi:hypothetical protein